MAKGTVSELEAAAGLQPTRPFECSWNDCPKVCLELSVFFPVGPSQRQRYLLKMED